MSYRSIKRVLGESSLEPKLLLLFVVSLLVLIGGSFWYVMQIAENLVRSSSQVKAQQLILTHLLRQHLESIPLSENSADYKEMYQSLSGQIPVGGAVMQIRVLSPYAPAEDLKAVISDDSRERAILQEIQDQFMSRIFPQMIAAAQGTTAADDSLALKQGLETGLSRDRFGGDRQYYFYQPLVFRSVCINCHNDKGDPSKAFVAPPNLDLQTQNRLREVAWQKDRPVFVVRAALPYRDFRTALNQTLAVLIAIAIATVFVSIFFLWLIVRYIIVKPLRHLQDVSDRISHGQLDTRSELKTGDEFEALSKSFNKMVRHLIDTQQALREANQDLDERIDEQAQLAMHLFEMNRLKSEFLTNMSHELRTPLNSILGFSDVLQSSQSLNEKQQRYAGNIKRSGRVLLELINDILDMAKLESGKMAVRPTDFQVRPLLTELTEMFRTLANEKRIDLVLRVPDALPLIHQDQMKVRQILTNLIGNAIKFTPEGGRIVLSAEAHDEHLVLHIADTGVGIADEERDLIFEKFRQGAAALGTDHLTREHSGTGLGLSIVRELCILLGGKIELVSEVGKGSLFTVTLPLMMPEPAPLTWTFHSGSKNLPASRVATWTAPLPNFSQPTRRPNSIRFHWGIEDSRPPTQNDL